MAPPIYVKGGVWTNVEDQILKAAVSKYGLTQWARVASLLPKKTAKQAKARWNEYLNPSIDRSKWTDEEDKKLLRLANLLPNQWRSIGPVMGRTATQCVERYQTLIDRQMSKEGDHGDDADDEDADLKLTGPGIEALPALGNAYESLPARPDLEDMSEDEQEMLLEARARLANNLGKKAKRKERERLLQESKRISLLQKRRELKAAGIRVSLELKNRKRRTEFDYNADIPHERQPAYGAHDVEEEDNANEEEKLQFLLQIRKSGIENDGLKKRKRETTKSGGDIKSAALVVLNLHDQQIAKRARLLLPTQGTPVSTKDIHVPLNMAQLVKKAFAALPPPKIEHPFVLPEIDVEDETTANSTPTTVAELGQRIPWRSQVVQRGLLLLGTLQFASDPSTSLERAIRAEATALASSDFARSIGDFSSPDPPLPTEKALEEVVAEVAKLENMNGATKVTHKPLKFEQACAVEIEDILTVLRELDGETLAKEIKDEEFDAAETLKTEEIHQAWAELQTSSVEVNLQKQILENEKGIIARRSDRLQRAADRIQAIVAEVTKTGK